MRTSDSQIGPIRKFILELLTELQEMTIKGDLKLYNFFTRLHFRVYSGKSLSKCATSDNIEEVDMFARAAHRHGNMVVRLVFKNSSNKKSIHSSAVSSFTKNFLLDKKV